MKYSWVLKVDKERGVGLVREVGKSPEDLTIVNLMQLTPKTELHGMCDTVLDKPIQVFEAQQLLTDEKGHNGVTFSEAYERYRSSRVRSRVRRVERPFVDVAGTVLFVHREQLGRELGHPRRQLPETALIIELAVAVVLLEHRLEQVATPRLTQHRPTT